MKVVTNAPILMKSLIAPALSAFMIIVIGVVFLVTYQDLQRQMEAQARISAMRSDLQEMMLALSAAHLDTLQAASWKQNVSDEALIAKSIEQAKHALATAQTLLDRQVSQDIVDPAKMAELVQRFAEYRPAATETLDTIQIDPFIALMLMNDSGVKQRAAVEVGGGVLAEVTAADGEIADDVRRSLSNTLLMVLATAALAIALSLGAAALLGRAISRPTTRLTAAMGQLTAGDTAVEIDGTERKDELGRMAVAVQVFKENMIRNIELSQQTAREQEERTARAERLEQLTAGFDAQVRALLRIVAEAAGGMNDTSGRLAETASSAHEQASALEDTAKEMSGNVQTVAAASEELSSSIGEISTQVQRQSGMARSASDAAEASRRQVRGLADAAQKIGEVIELITGIAEQTNLLALNATIEAARAGEAGKGFAIVASEVKNLATQTAKATDEISSQIQAMQSQTGSTVDAIERINAQIREMTEVSATVASAVEEQNAATQEISRSAQQASQGTERVTGSIQAMTQAAEGTGAASTEVTTAAQGLSENAEALKRLIDAFLTDVKAA
jgi:methyl-accepting chemotaxis protein